MAGAASGARCRDRQNSARARWRDSKRTARWSFLTESGILSKSLSFTSKTVRREAEHAQGAIGEPRIGRSGEKHPDCATGQPERRKDLSRKWENVPTPQAVKMGANFGGTCKNKTHKDVSYVLLTTYIYNVYEYIYYKKRVLRGDTVISSMQDTSLLAFFSHVPPKLAPICCRLTRFGPQCILCEE